MTPSWSHRASRWTNGMELISIEVATNPELAKQLRDLLDAQWPGFGRFDQEEGGLRSPSPLVATEHGELLGGLAFSLWKDPDSECKSIWINGLVVKRAFRERGVATSLIRMAMEQTSRLHVRTDRPNLYGRLGWRVLSTKGDLVIMEHQAIPGTRGSG
jgi:GNAT superfamily N-acetyltransferase